MARINWAIPKRFLRLTLKSGLSGNPILSELNESSKITFNTSDTVGGGSAEGNITITGIRTDKMAFLSSTSSQWMKNAVQNRITIDAGYYNRHAIVFTGLITEATPNLNSADFTITIKALSGFDMQIGAIKNYSFPGATPASKIANTFAADLKYVFINALPPASDKIITNYSTEGLSIIDNIRYLSKLSGLDIYINYNRLIIKSVGSAVHELGELIIDNRNLIGNITITSIGIDCKIKMDPTVIGGQLVKLKSTRFKTVNNMLLAVQCFNHSGDTFGPDWATTLKLVRCDLLR